MMTSSTGEPTGDHTRFQPPVVKPLPVQRDATAATPAHRPHDSPALRFSDGDIAAISPLARDGRPRLSELERRQSAGQPGPEWDLRDDIIQQLFAIGIAMGITQRRCNDHPDVAARIADHMKDLQRIVDELRSSMPEPRTLPAQSLLS